MAYLNHNALATNVSQPQRYHASTWPLALTPSPRELLILLDRDYGLSPRSTDSELSAALHRAGHGTVMNAYTYQLHSLHSARRHEALTGEPF